MPVVIMESIMDTEEAYIEISGHLYIPWELELVNKFNDKYISDGGEDMKKTEYLALFF